MKNNYGKTQKLVLSALFLALEYVLPFLTGQIPEIGAMLCPMHLPGLLCGFIIIFSIEKEYAIAFITSKSVLTLVKRNMLRVIVVNFAPTKGARFKFSH